MKIGADYYPEHWPKERWKIDADLMMKAGISLVRVGEFAWSRFEPEPGRIDFGWLDKAIGILVDRGIDVVMGTPTATPPKWLCDAAEKSGDPVYQVDAAGRRRAFGTRRHYCHNHPDYREETRRIVQAQANHYADNGAIIAWQIDNEFGCHETTVCYCDHCRTAFAGWLKNRYGDISALNSAWGTVFWSQEYRSFDEVIVPTYTSVDQSGWFTHNPGLLLDYQRFSSDSVVAYQKIQTETIRKYTDTPITHNFMGHFGDIDYYDLADDLDFVSWDNYPQNQWEDKPDASAIAMAHDITRGTRRQNFWVMEQLSGPCGWAVLGPTPAPGRIRLWSYQGAAHGADVIVYFRWRPALFGTEQYWYGILDHDGEPGRRYREISQVAEEFAAISGSLDGTSYPADVLIVRSFDNLWAQRHQPHAHGLDYEDQLQRYYDGFAATGAQIDVHMLTESLDRYRVIAAPLLNLTTSGMESELDEYVRSGGTLVLTFRSGTRSWNNSMRATAPPGPFAEMAGVSVEEFDALSGTRSVGLTGRDIDGRASLWLDVLTVADDVEVLAAYTDGHYNGKPAITRRRLGGGAVYYVGCDLDDEALMSLCAWIVREAGISSVRRSLLFHPPECVEAVVRSRNAEGPQSLFLLNHSDDDVAVGLVTPGRDLIRDESCTTVLLEPYGVAVLEV